MKFNVDVMALWIAFVIGLFLGVVLTDSQTFQKCAVKGEAPLVAAGNIKCEIKKGGS